ncbi:DNA cytosine methyltransferase [Sporolactobacillus sp. KGMB 08714]|uniref:DNA cytosine methyltransferase n=1 Tax=Sporolactobacillus sp. KGMB 08714 TaxID=3064704 RepID=UPI002FBD54D5
MKQLNLFREIIVDNFAGGGGASTGIELATGINVDIAINHDPDAIAMHKANHPDTEHYCESVWNVDPKRACAGRPVGLCWLSPDCKHFSKAKGGKPVNKNIRGLAWIAIKWAISVRPRVIMLENVEEFQTWGPLMLDSKNQWVPDSSKKGQTFKSFLKAFKSLGYQVDYRELRACDYGAPTNRKRFFLIARCDGRSITWPKPTNGDPNSLAVKAGKLKPWRTAAEIINWSLSCPSIFERKRPLAENTMKRIARGIKKFVVDNPEPFIVHIGQQKFEGDRLSYSVNQPLTAIVSKAEHCLVAPFLAQYHSYESDGVRGQALDRPLLTVDTSNRYALTVAFMQKYFAGGYKGSGASVDKPLPTVTAVDHNALTCAYLTKFYSTCTGSDMRQPVPTITATGQHIGEVQAFLIKYYGKGTGQSLEKPLGTVTSHDTFGLVKVYGQDYQIVDIGMRMLQPRELFDAQGFPHNYIIDHDCTGKTYPKSKQVARCGNAVPPQFVEALVRTNMPELCVAKHEWKLAVDQI